MQRNQPATSPDFIAKLIAVGQGAPSTEEKLRLIQSLHERAPETFNQEMLKIFDRLATNIAQAGAMSEELRRRLQQLVGKLWLPAIFLFSVGQPEDGRVMVNHGGTERVVGLSDDVDLESLTKGCEVMLNHELSAVVAKSARAFPRTGEIATVVEQKTDGSIIIRSRDDDIAIAVAASLEGVELKANDRVRWVRSAWLAYEKVTDSRPPRFQSDEVPDIHLDAVGGQDENVAKLMNALSTVLVAPELAAEFGLSSRCSVLIEGPPGCGKTLMVRAAVAEIARMTGRTARFFVVKPAEWESWLVGGTENNIRELFASLRRAADEGALVVLFLDEVDAVGRARGHVQGHYSDKALNALLAELDGFSGREGVAVVATTNRADLIDAALLQRLSDHSLRVGAPDMAGARAIFSIHLPASTPFSPNGTAAMLTRRDAIDVAVARFYSPNSPFAEVARIKFRDGKSRMVQARELASGRLFSQICHAARDAAFRRARDGGEFGVQVADMEDAVATAIVRVAQNLTVHNIRNQIANLPTDVDVVAVEPTARKVTRPNRFLRVEALAAV